MNLSQKQLNVIRGALHSHLAYGDWQDNAHADIVTILNIIGEARVGQPLDIVAEAEDIIRQNGRNKHLCNRHD